MAVELAEWFDRLYGCSACSVVGLPRFRVIGVREYQLDQRQLVDGGDRTRWRRPEPEADGRCKATRPRVGHTRLQWAEGELNSRHQDFQAVSSDSQKAASNPVTDADSSPFRPLCKASHSIARKRGEMR